MIGEHFTSNNRHPDIRFARFHAAMASTTGQLLFAIPGGQFGVRKWRAQDTRNWASWGWDGKLNRSNWQEALACGQALDGTLAGAMILPPGADVALVYALDAQNDALTIDNEPTALRRGAKGWTVDYQRPVGVAHHGTALHPMIGQAWAKFDDGSLPSKP